jgi:sodium transport system permease protein
MPLMLVTMPLVILPMAPGVELTLGNSLIPVTGVVLLLRAMLEGNYWHALPFVAPVAAVTLACCLWAIRWAIDQFNSESVLFRESERLDMGLWLRHLLRDRGDTPSPAMALFCGVLILLVQFFMNFAINSSMPEPQNFHDLTVLVMITQLVVILTPALLMTVMLTRSPRQTLLLRRPPLLALPAAVMLALCLHPVAARFGELVQHLYPIRSEIPEQLNKLLSQTPSIGHLLLLMAVTPAVCEELAFRGFILSGLRHIGHKWWAIAISSLFFGILHGVLQQSIVACTVGLVIGYIAVQSGSLFPCMLFHLVHNSLTVLAGSLSPKELGYNPFPAWFALPLEGGGYEFGWPAVALGAALSLGLLAWFRSLPYARTAEETLQDALEHQSAPAAAR